MFSFFKKNKENRLSTGFFVPSESGFVESSEFENLSINQMAEKMGYHPDMVHHFLVSYNQTDEIQSILLEVFTKNIILVITSKNVLSLSESKVNRLIDVKGWNDLYDSFTIKDILEEAINNESFTIDYLQRVLELPDKDVDVFSKKLGYYLYFNEGILCDFQTADGLNEWAKDWKINNKKVFEGYEKEAKIYWGDDTLKITQEINAQADAWANFPGRPSENPFVHLHKTDCGNINFVNLLVAHYGKEISLREFKALNHGRHQTTAVIGNEITLKVGRFLYEFNDGIFVDAEEITW